MKTTFFNLYCNNKQVKKIATGVCVDANLRGVVGDRSGCCCEKSEDNNFLESKQKVQKKKKNWAQSLLEVFFL